MPPLRNHPASAAQNRFISLKILLSLLLTLHAVQAKFALTEDAKFFTIDCESNPAVVVKVNKANGNLQSIRVNNTELQKNSRGSHINSGFGNSSVTSRSFGQDRILITVEKPELVHYYTFQKGSPAVFMATWAAKCPHPGEMRFIARLDSRVLNRGNIARPNDNTSSKIIEGKDIFIHPNGNTHSKFYSAVRFIDDAIHGSRGDKIGAYFAIGSYESSSGGPFFRDINSQTAGDTEEIYFYMFSGHAQTEPFRKDQLHGPYALCFTEGPPPAMPAMNWMKDLGLRAWVSQRGRVTGTATRLLPGVPYTAYLSNEIAQYWTRIDANGKFTSTAMKPGTYSLRLMRNELAVAETQVTVTHADTASVQLQDPGLPSYLWRLGLPDGTPQGFRNASKMSDMHPSDKRHQAWGPLTFNIREPVPKNLSDFPAIQWRDINNRNRIVFSLKPSQIKDRDLEIGITVSQFASRPIVRVNDRWTHRAPAAPRTYDSRSITFGIHRGFDHVHSIRIPKSAFNAGENSLTLENISGSGGSGFLSNAFVYDFIGLRD